jgi:hypothetical protein
VGPRAALDTVVKRKIPSPRRKSKPRTPIVQPVALCSSFQNHRMQTFSLNMERICDICVLLRHKFLCILLLTLEVVWCLSFTGFLVINKISVRSPWMENQAIVRTFIATENMCQEGWNLPFHCSNDHSPIATYVCNQRTSIGAHHHIAK